MKGASDESKINGMGERSSGISLTIQFAVAHIFNIMTFSYLKCYLHIVCSECFGSHCTIPVNIHRIQLDKCGKTRTISHIRSHDRYTRAQSRRSSRLLFGVLLILCKFY